ncbi:hypothetical protein D3C87_1720910 [compost metagenome]
MDNPMGCVGCRFRYVLKVGDKRHLPFTGNLQLQAKELGARKISVRVAIVLDEPLETASAVSG